MYTIRKYTPADKERLRFICKETTWDDNKTDENKLDSIAVIYNDYFTEYEPENIFVAVNEDDIPVGYVICSSNFKLFKEKMLGDIKNRVKNTYAPSLLIFYPTGSSQRGKRFLIGRQCNGSAGYQRLHRFHEEQSPEPDPEDPFL